MFAVIFHLLHRFQRDYTSLSPQKGNQISLLPITSESDTTRSLVLYLKMGLPLWDAAREAVLDLYALDDPYASKLNIVAIDTHGNHVGFGNRPEQLYIFQTAEMDTPAERLRIYVGPDGKAEED